MKFNSFLFIACVFYCDVSAQVGFQAHTIIDNSNSARGPWSVYTADLDGDGDKDLLSASLDDNKIAWYKNLDGQGSFGNQQIISTNAIGARSVFAADLDGDGDVDVLSASFDDEKIAWYENTNGLGNFGDEQLITTGTDILGAVSVFATDIDGDEDMDVLSVSFLDNKVAWYQNNGQGNFSAPLIISTQAEWLTALYSSDLDSDGDMDVLSANSGNNDKIAWYENDGQGNFGPLNTITTNIDQPHGVFASDLDGDGDMDVLSASTADDKVAWYENVNSQGVFGSQQIISTSTNGATSVFSTDIDGDGDMDVLSASSFDHEISWFENIDGQGDFGSQQFISNNANGAMYVYADDIDGDGDMDVFSASDNDDKIAWYENTDGLGNFGEEQILTSNAIGAFGVYAADMDSDGDMDVLTTSNQDHEVAWHKNINGQGYFGDQQIIASQADAASYVYATDLDGDGDMDALSALRDADKIVWYRNTDGNGTFSVEQIINENANSARIVTAGDLDGDGDMDVLSFSSGNNKVAWYENNGQGNFGVPQTISDLADWTDFIEVADLDGDGDLDVLYPSRNDDKIVWHENMDALGDFGDQQIISSIADGPNSAYAVDIDSDGDLDVVSSTQDDNNIGWYENTDGLGNFGDQQIISPTAGGLFGTIYTADVDGDGDVDVIGTLPNSNQIVWYENIDGLGNFGTQQIIGTFEFYAEKIYASDLDGDGDVDILLAFPNDNKIVWYENLSPTTNELNGVIRLDINDNGCDPSDLLVSNVMVSTIGGTDDLTTFSLHNGIYQQFPGIGDFTTGPDIADYFTASPNTYSSSFVDIGNTETTDFCIESTQDINDVHISFYPTREARPGFNVTYILVFHNLGTTQLTGSIVLEFDDTKLDFLTVSEPVASQNNNTLTFDYSNLDPFEIRTINLEYNVFPPPTVNIDEVLTFTTTINPVAGDNTPIDNVITFDQPVVGSFDPNDISVLEGEEILLENADEYLHYIIRFQNTGTAEAINVEVKNILDANLDWNTFQPETSSHIHRIEIKEGNEVSFIFEDINLPDSISNEPDSHGFIAYKIKPKSDIVIGDLISNEADIFFDFNLPVETNTVITEVVEQDTTSKSTEAITFRNNLNIYPNPVNNFVNITSDKESIKSIFFYSTLGKIVKEASTTTIDTSTLPTGTYILMITTESGKKAFRKLIKLN